MEVNSQIFITSINKAINRAKVVGEFNLLILSLVDIYIYYINYTEELISLGLNFKAQNKQLKEELLKLKYKYSSVICNYKNVLPVNTNDPIGINLPPTSSNNALNLNTNISYQFKVSDFILNFTDPNNDSYKYLLINPLQSNLYGVLKTGSDTLLVSSPIVINIEGLTPSTLIDLYYTRTDYSSYGPDIFSFRVSDDQPNYLYSILYTFGISATITTIGNQPPSNIGDITLYKANRAITVLTLSMFTSDLIAPYNDPEGDLIDAIKIIDISNANQGIYYLNGTPIVEGQIITREDINAGLFIHSGPNTDSVTSDVFEFQARDEGSLIWID